MNKLIGMTYFVLERDKREEVCREDFIKCRNYANFLKQPLELWQFVPCKLVKGVWVVLEEPINYSSFEVGMSGKDFGFNFIDCEEYELAKERCLFEGFEAKKIKDFYLIFLGDKEIWVSWNDSKTIEDLIKYEPLLTKTAIKQLSL